MEQRSPDHFVAGLFQAIAPDSPREGRKTERRRTLRMPDAAEVHGFYMHAPDEEQSDRCLCARRNDSAEAS
jgi:hypothetical protein